MLETNLLSENIFYFCDLIYCLCNDEVNSVLSQCSMNVFRVFQLNFDLTLDTSPWFIGLKAEAS